MSLKNKKIVLTRPTRANIDLAIRIQEKQAIAVNLPLIDISHDHDVELAEEILPEISSYDWIVFCSKNAVTGFFKMFFSKYKDIRCLGKANIACVGPATAMEVKNYHLGVEAIAIEFKQEKIPESMNNYQSIENLKILVPQGNLSDDTLKINLEKNYRAIVDTIEVYQTKHTDLLKEKNLDFFKANGADAIVFASPSAVEAFAKNAGILSLSKKAITPKVFSIGPLTSEALKKKHIENFIEAKEYTSQGVFKALEDFFSK